MVNRTDNHRSHDLRAGWLVEAGRDEALDAAMTAAGYEQVTIKHGNGNLVTHWAIETADVFPLADGVQGMGEMKLSRDRYGVAFWWEATEDGRPCSRLSVQVLLRPLLEAGYDGALLLTARSTVTGDVLTALLRQYVVLDAIDALRKEQGKPALDPPFYACSIPIGPGAEVQRGTAQKKGIVPPVVLVPDVIDRAYLLAHYIRKEWVAGVEARIEGAINWSVQRSQQGAEATQDAPGAAEAGEGVESLTLSDHRISAAKGRIKAVTGAASWAALVGWLGDARQAQPTTDDEWDGLARWVATVATERAKANGLQPAL